MEQCKLISGYLKDETLRASFNNLLKGTFSLDGETWYKQKAFYRRYTPYSFELNNQIISNVSVNRFDLMINGCYKKAIQLGTVMTDKDYKNKGLSKQLINNVLDTYKDKMDLIFLYANASVLNFYPKFGFKRYYETAYEISADKVLKSKTKVKLLNHESVQDVFTITNLSKARKPISKIFGVFNDRWPLHFYILSSMFEKYYFIEEDVIVIAERKDGVLNLYDIISRTEINIDDVLEKMVNENDKLIKINFYCEPSKYQFNKLTVDDDDHALFIISKEPLNEEIIFSITSRT